MSRATSFYRCKASLAIEQIMSCLPRSSPMSQDLSHFANQEKIGVHKRGHIHWRSAAQTIPIAIECDMSRPKKKRRPHVAPRFTRERPPDANEKRVATSEQEQAVRDLFSSSTCRCFVLKSFSEANVHKSLKFGIWSTTALHSALLDQVYRASSLTADRPVLLFFRYSQL